jgi:glycerol-3-phosphate acyltransferase PlsY
MTWIDNLRFANPNQVLALWFCAYSVGCFTAGYYLVRIRTGKDIREHGSGSVGARNVSRVLGKFGFFLTLLFDFGKGALVVWSARHLDFDDRAVGIACLGVVAGHIWPAQLRFHGGKGMATSLGCLIVFDPKLALAFAILFMCFLIIMRRTVLTGLLALTFVPLVGKFLGRTQVEVLELSILAGFVLLAHRKNIFEEISQIRHADGKPDHPHV